MEKYFSRGKVYFTIRGLLFDKFEKIPEQNDEIIIGDYKFQITEMTGNRIEKVKVTLL